MSKQVIQIDSPLTAAGFASVCDLSPGPFEALIALQNYFGAVSGGNQTAKINVNVGAGTATGKFTFASVIATDVLTINGVTFTCVASGATGNQFNVGVSNAATAANAAAAINASATALVSGTVLASSLGADVLLEAKVAGEAGNAITIATADATITPSGARLTGGSDGTAYVINE